MSAIITVGRQDLHKLSGLLEELSGKITKFVSGAQRKEAHKFYESLGYQLDEVQGFRKYLD